MTALRESGQLGRIIAALRAHAERPWPPSTRPGPSSPLGGGGGDRAPAVGRVGAGRSLRGCGPAPTALLHASDAAFALVANRLADPCLKRRLREWLAEEVAMPTGFVALKLDQLYWTLDQVEAA